MKNFKLTDETIGLDGRILHRIECIKGFINDYTEIHVGQRGGFVESESNIRGNAWVYDNSCVYENAIIDGNARVRGNAKVFGSAVATDEATISVEANVCGNAKIMDAAHVSGRAMVFGFAKVYDWADVSGDAVISGHADISGGAVISGNARICKDGNVECTNDFVSIDSIITNVSGNPANITAFKCVDGWKINYSTFANTLAVFKSSKIPDITQEIKDIVTTLVELKIKQSKMEE